MEGLQIVIISLQKHDMNQMKFTSALQNILLNEILLTYYKRRKNWEEFQKTRA